MNESQTLLIPATEANQQVVLETSKTAQYHHFLFVLHSWILLDVLEAGALI